MLHAHKSTMGPQFKFGIEVPSSPAHALQLDKANGNNLWHDTIEKELKQINDYETFKVLEKGETLPKSYTKIPYHFVFDVKFDL